MTLYNIIVCSLNRPTTTLLHMFPQLVGSELGVYDVGSEYKDDVIGIYNNAVLYSKLNTENIHAAILCNGVDRQLIVPHSIIFYNAHSTYTFNDIAAIKKWLDPLCGPLNKLHIATSMHRNDMNILFVYEDTQQMNTHVF